MIILKKKQPRKEEKMVTYEKIIKFSKILEQYAEELDISESKYIEAKDRYEAVGEWLGKDDSKLFKYKPEIYPQGSFCLGTVIKPISNKDEYDIDLVCFLSELKKQNTSQYELKKVVGDRLNENEMYKGLLEKEGNRCWTLNYADEFHMDILPSIADDDMRILGGFYTDAILITDKKEINNNNPEWPKSNPKGYANWFQTRQEKIFVMVKKQLAEVEKANVDEIPNFRVKTPLQRAIQILKRHRDIYFSKKDERFKPISIIITTLSAIRYNGENDIYNAIFNIISSLDVNMLIKENEFKIPNPVNPGENFADAWNENSLYVEAFKEWINDVKKVFSLDIIEKADIIKVQSVEKSLGIKLENNQSLETTNFTPVYTKINNSQKNRPWGILNEYRK